MKHQIKGMSNAEVNVLNELRNTIYQDRPLIDLVVKNFTERNMSTEQISNTLYELHASGKIELKYSLEIPMPFDKIIIAHHQLAREQLPGQF